MNRNRSGFRIARVTQLSVLVLFLVAAVSTSTHPALAATPSSVDTLIAVATDSLRADYDLLVSGTATRSLTPKVNEFGVAEDPATRANRTLARRMANVRAGLTFTSAEIALSDVSVFVSGSELHLLASERAMLSFRSVNYAHDPTRDRMVTIVGHTFVFALRQGAWALVHDEVDPFPLNRSNDPIPAPDKTAQPARSSARASTGAHFASPLRAGWYDWPAAQTYIRNYALNYNPAYRTFADVGGDCTNFASQVMRAGGWVDRPGWYLDWNNWWYNDLNQTRSWTYTHAFQQFFNTSGRGQFLSYLVDMWIGDAMQIDFGANGTIDHTMLVDDKISSTLDGIFMSYHTTNTYHRPLSDVLAVYPIPGNNYWAMHVIGTNP